jgi:two-component sensor histidine kinase
LRNGADVELRQLVDMKLEELQQTIALFDDGSPNAAMSVVQTDRGRELMGDIRAAIADRQTEARALADAASERSRYYSERSGFVSTLLAGLLGLATIMGLVTLFLWFRADRAVVEAEEAADTAERIEVIARELDHRMKNMFAVAQGMLRQSARGRGDAVELYSDEASARLTAMSHAYSATRGLGDARTLGSDALIERVVRAQLLGEHRLDVSGDAQSLPEEAVTPLALILHEWTTNSLKYGAWSPECHEAGGRVRLDLQRDADGALHLEWDESCLRDSAEAPASKGYGSKLIRACAAQLGGKVEADWHGDGVRFKLMAAADRVAV